MDHDVQHLITYLYRFLSLIHKTTIEESDRGCHCDIITSVFTNEEEPKPTFKSMYGLSHLDLCLHKSEESVDGDFNLLKINANCYFYKLKTNTNMTRNGLR